MTRTPVYQQTLYRHQALDRMLCRRCNDGHHKWCERYECQCPCLDPRKPRVRVKRDRDGLTPEEQRDQADFPFDEHVPLEVKAGTSDSNHETNPTEAERIKL